MRNPIDIRGEVAVVTVYRRGGKVVETVVDAAVVERVAEKRWCFNSNGYIRSTDKRGRVYLHRYLTGAARGRVVDHINHDRLDNRLSNLRVTTGTINGLNRKDVQKNVYWLPRVGLYVVRFQVHGRPRLYGQFADPVEAGIAAEGVRRRLLAGELPPTTRQPKRPNTGVSFNSERGMWHARPFISGRRVSLGWFKTREEALAAAHRPPATTSAGVAGRRVTR